jgi:hypothetical protein
MVTETCETASEDKESIREGKEETEEDSETIETDEDEGRRLQQNGGKGVYVWKALNPHFSILGVGTRSYQSVRHAPWKRIVTVSRNLRTRPVLGGVL